MKLDMKAFEKEIGVEPLDVTEAVKVTEMSTAMSAPTYGSPEDVYKEYAELVKVGKNVLQQVGYTLSSMPPDGETISSVASVITSIKDVLHEFSKLHVDLLKHQRTIEMENLKQTNREKLLQLKYEMSMKEGSIEAEGTIAFNQENAMALLDEAFSIKTVTPIKIEVLKDH